MTVRLCNELNPAINWGSFSNVFKLFGRLEGHLPLVTMEVPHISVRMPLSLVVANSNRVVRLPHVFLFPLDSLLAITGRVCCPLLHEMFISRRFSFAKRVPRLVVQVCVCLRTLIKLFDKQMALSSNKEPPMTRLPDSGVRRPHLSVSMLWIVIALFTLFVNKENAIVETIQFIRKLCRYSQQDIDRLVRTVTFLWKPECPSQSLRPDWYGYRTSMHFLSGYGMDSKDGSCRQLPAIFIDDNRQAMVNNASWAFRFDQSDTSSPINRSRRPR